MHKVDAADATPANEYTDGEPGVTPATVIAAKWLNSVQRELIKPITEAGITLDDEDDEQLYNAILTLISNNRAEKGYIKGRFSVTNAFPKILTIRKNNIYEVNGNIIRVSTPKNIDFNAITATFRSDGTTPIVANTETQNKHLYLSMNTAGDLTAQIIPDIEMEASNHGYAYNPELIKDFYAASPTNWDSDKNGYYKNSKRIIGFCRLDGSNNIEFYYELGFGHRFMDVETLPVAGKFIELRWKREHPACYYPDGSTIAALATEAPELHGILGSTTLPDWRDRFGRNIDLAGGRAIRDLQDDAFQGHHHQIRTYPLSLTGGAQQSPYPTGTMADLDIIGNPSTDGVNGTPRTASETRPMNYAELVQIVRG